MNNKRGHYNTYLGLSLCLFGLLVPAGNNAIASPYNLEVSKSQRELLIKQDDHVIRRFRISYGRGGNGAKEHIGDNKTPVGVYKIMNFKADSKFHYFMQLSYPNLVDAWHGYKKALITAGEFKRIALAYKNKQPPPQNTSLGGYIGIHGIGEINKEKLKLHNLFNWTEGCIALTNDEINELLKYVTVGTQVVIKE